MKATLWLSATALAAALAAGPALAAGDSAKQGMQHQGASAGTSAGQAQHDQSTVRQAQERLNQLGYDVGEPDGIWGPQTQAALEKYQEEQGLSTSGELDSQTIAKLGIDSVGGSGTAAGASSPSMSGSSSSPSSPSMGGSSTSPSSPSMSGSSATDDKPKSN